MRFIAASLLVLSIRIAATNAIACDCVSPATPRDRLDQASVVFSGTVIASTVATAPKWTAFYRFQVIDRFKGEVPSEVVLEHEDSDCSFHFEAGASYLVYAYGKQRLFAHTCSATQRLSSAGPEIEALEKLRDKPATSASKPNGYFLRDKATGIVHLKANEFAMREPVTFIVHELWRLNPRSKQWEREPFTPTAPKQVVRSARSVYGAASDATIAPITNRIGLFWVKWSENGASFEQFALAGMVCNDVHIGTPPPGQVATCIPYEDHAEAAFVPDPHAHCVTTAGARP
ncbi:MAG: hypothetical protein U0V87_05050 [Acidobacteriota bacterium]